MKFTFTGEYCASEDEEIFYNTYSTKEEALKACIEDEAGNYVGEIYQVDFDETDFNYEIGYRYGEKLFNEVGDVAETWDLPRENEIELNKMIGKLIADYLTEHKLQPTCCKVINVIQVVK